MVDRVKLGKASKARGSGFETEVANKLCAWYKDNTLFLLIKTKIYALFIC